MAAMTMDREPDMARFIDTYKFDQEMASRREKFGGGTSLPLHSDGYEDKQRALREERHHDWMVQQEKNLDHPYTIIKHPNMAPVSYGPQNAADYDEEINKMTDRYNTGYDEQKQLEEEKFSSRHRAPPRPVQPMGPQIDYNQAGELAKAEEKRAYQDYMGKYQYTANVPPKPPIDYEENKKLLNEERRREYNQLMEKKAKEERYWQMRGRPVTPPGGLNIGNYDRQLKETAAAKKKEYKEMLDQQQKEHMYLRAKQEPGVPVIDRNAPYLASKPPPGPVYNRPPPRDEAFKTNSYSRQPPPAPEQALNGPSGFSNDGLRPAENRTNGYYDRPPQSSGRPRSRPSLESDKKNAPPTNMESGMQISPRRMKNTLYQDSEEVSLKRLEASKERQKDYNEYLKSKNEERRRHDEEKYQNVSKPAEVVKNQYYSSDDYEKFQKEIQRKQSEEYREFLAKKFQPPAERIGLPLGQYKYEPKRLAMEAERNAEYNSLIKERQSPRHKGVTPEATSLTLPVGQYDLERPYLEKQRNDEYNQLLHTGRIGKKHLRDKAPTPPYQQGLPIGQQNYEPMHKAMEYQRNKEYNEFLRQKYGRTSQRSTRSEPDLAKASFYFGSDNVHEQKKKMLDTERRNEYNKFVREHEPARSRSIEIPSDVDSGLPIGQQHHEAWRRFLREQRNREYNQLVDMKAGETRNRDWNVKENGVLELHGDDAVQSKQRELRAERQKEYNNYISQQKVKHPDRRHDFVDTASGPYGGLFHGLGEHGNRSEMLNKERQREYNEQYAGKDKISGRPNWARETLPNNVDRGRSPMKVQPPVDQYQQMLDEKRREEMSRRRYDDPEYQGRLADSREREAGQRYAGY